MTRSKLAVSISLGLLPLMMSLGCTRERVVVVHDRPPAQPAAAAEPAPAAAQPAPAAEEEGQDVEAESDPPAEQVEAVPVSPGPDHVWIKGHWRWVGRWEWRPGHWEVIRRGHEWVPGHWEHRRHRRWVWIPGHWRRI